MGSTNRELRNYILNEDIPLLMKMNELAKRGPTGNFLELWKLIRVCIWKKLQNGSGLTDQERVVREKLKRMVKYKRQQLH
jgi:hypothetical protein